LATQLAEISTPAAFTITLEEIDKRPLIVKLRDAAARLSMPHI
jgi:hypothetical protein